MTEPRNEKLVLSAFLQASNCSNYAPSWRHPETNPEFLTAHYYQNIARTLEDGKFHMAFFDDRLAMPSVFGDSADEAIRHGIRAVKLDPVPVMMAMAMATKHLGVAATYSTTYYPPFHLARMFSSIDHMTGGRAAWNVVTSLNDTEAQNFGMDKHIGHDDRYDIADEVMEIATGLWDTWDSDALVMDKERAFFADPSKVRSLDYQGKYLKSRGPLTVPRSPQGRPVIIQAGQSERGRQFAARWGELIFVIVPAAEVCKTVYDSVKELVAKNGRDPNSVKVSPAVYVVVGETENEAQEKLGVIDSLVQPIDSLVLLSELFNYDFASHDLDAPLSNDELNAITGAHGLRDIVIRMSGKANPTVRDFLEHSRRGTVRELPVFAGTPEHIADRMEEWFTARTCDGFVIAATHMPGAYEDFTRFVVPELQRRGLHHKDYSGSTLRENIGLPYPALLD